MLVGWKQGEKTAEKSISVLGRKSEMKHGREMFVWGVGGRASKIKKLQTRKWPMSHR